jgi:hypothetical protein
MGEEMILKDIIELLDGSKDSNVEDRYLVDSGVTILEDEEADD